MALGHRRVFICAAGALAALSFCAPAAAQQSQVKAVTLSSLAEQGFEVKAVGKGDGLIVQKGKDVFLCTLRLANTSPLSYQSECYAIREATNAKGFPVLRDDINKALTEAMKAKNERAVSTLRMVNSTLKNADIEARGGGKPALGDAETLAILQKMIKQRQESVEMYKKGARADLVKQEEEEIAIISAYLPKQMSDADVAAAIEAAIKDTGAAGMKDMGKVIGALRAEYAGQMDFGKASGIVKAKLQ